MTLPMMTVWILLGCIVHLFLRLTIIFYYRFFCLNAKEKEDRANRAHANCVTQVVTYAPLVLFIAISYGDHVGVWLGLYYLIANVMYAVGYTRDGMSRRFGFMVYFFMTWIISVITLATIGYDLLALNGWFN